MQETRVASLYLHNIYKLQDYNVNSLCDRSIENLRQKHYTEAYAHSHTHTHTHTHTHSHTHSHSHTPPLSTCLFDTTLTYMCAAGCPDGEGSGAVGSLPDTPYLDQQNILRTATLIAKEDRGTKEAGEREKLVNA